MKKIALFVFGFSLLAQSYGQFTVSKIYNNSLVIQRDVTVPVWGKSIINDTIFAEINGVFSDTVVVQADLKWEVKLAPMPAGGPYTLILHSAKYVAKTFTDIQVGDVWLASGQSNMEYAMSETTGGLAAAAAADDNLIREFKISKGLSKTLSDELPAALWKVATPANVTSFSAIAYYFAKDIRPIANVPIGIINNSYGGARIEAYLSEQELGYDEDVAVLQGGTYQERQPTLVYNKMVHPLFKFPIKGIIWYQGESNADYLEDALAYGPLFDKLIKSWRTSYGLGDIPFIWVQLPNQGDAGVETPPQTWDAWQQLRAAQSRALKLPNTAEAIAIDLGEADIHPKEKERLAKRLSLLARTLVYKEDTISQSPRLKGYEILTDGSVAIDFETYGSSLSLLEGATNAKWFSIAGSNGTFYAATTATVSGNRVTISNTNVTTPKTIRYLWDKNPVNPNLYNTQGLAAAPFYLELGVPAYSKTFTATKATIERGNTVQLSWNVKNANTVTYNGLLVDSVSSIFDFPVADKNYALVIQKTDLTYDTLRLTVKVIDPQPTISVSTSLGDVLSLKAETILKSNTNAPGGGTVVSVEYFINGTSYAIDNAAPFESPWTPDTLGLYTLTGKVTDAKNYQTTSAPYKIDVTNMVLLTYEAENATLTGDASIKSNATDSKGRHVEAQNDWTITFANVDVPQAGTYQMTIAYWTNFGDTKAQNLLVNGVNKGEITYENVEGLTWQKQRVNVTLLKGLNTIAITKSWGWMSFDYIAIAVDAKKLALDGYSSSNGLSITTYPNPSKDVSTIEFDLPKAGDINIDLFDQKGIKVSELTKGYFTEGKHSIPLDTNKLTNGIYFATLKHENGVATKKIVIQK